MNPELPASFLILEKIEAALKEELKGIKEDIEARR